MATKEAQRSPAGPEAALLFVLIVGVAVGVTFFLPPGFFAFWRNAVMLVSLYLGPLLGIQVHASMDLLTVNGFAMRIADECTAVNYAIILAVAILLYPRHPFGYRLAGVAVTLPLVILFNALRLLVTGISGAVSWNLFRLVHEYAFVALFALLVFLMWKTWVDRTFQMSHKLLCRLLISLISCSAVFALLAASVPAYGTLLAALGSEFLKFLLQDSSIPVEWMNDHFRVLYHGRFYRTTLPLEYFNLSVFIGLVLPHAWKKPASLALCGFALLTAVTLNGFFLANTLYLMITYGGIPDPFLATQKGLLLALPFALWWIVASPAKPGSSDQKSGTKATAIPPR